MSFGHSHPLGSCPPLSIGCIGCRRSVTCFPDVNQGAVLDFARGSFARRPSFLLGNWLQARSRRIGIQQGVPHRSCPCGCPTSPTMAGDDGFEPPHDRVRTHFRGVGSGKRLHRARIFHWNRLFLLAKEPSSRASRNRVVEVQRGIGAEEDRTLGLKIANLALSQLSYSPIEVNYVLTKVSAPTI